MSARERVREQVAAWRPPVPGVREVFHARFVDHAYPPHTHDAWTVLLVDAGGVRYSLDRHDHGMAASTVSLLPPHVVHDGRAASDVGFRKRVVYVEPEVIGDGLIGPAVDRPVVADAGLVSRIRRLHGALLHPDDAFEAEARLSFVAEGLRRALRPGAADAESETGARGAPPGLADLLRDLLDARLFDGVTLAEAGAVLGASPTHLVRSFTRAFGVAPHAYVLGRRIDAARRQMLEGRPLAEVAAGIGFHDQSHLTRHFRRHVGTTPARYVRHHVALVGGSSASAPGQTSPSPPSPVSIGSPDDRGWSPGGVAPGGVVVEAVGDADSEHF
jgi:AraC-like DNA-binding protein